MAHETPHGDIDFISGIDVDDTVYISDDPYVVSSDSEEDVLEESLSSLP